jgi:hypothetical protein
MTEPQTIHKKAMDIAEEASFEQAAGRLDHAKQLYAAAFELERQAAELLDTRVDLEPTRSVLFRSAASLALDCGEFRAAERLLARALAGDPPPEIASELRDLFEQVNLHRHLDVRGIVLGSREFQMSITGNAVGLGVADSDVFVGRVQDIEKLLRRTAERQANHPFRDRGRRPKTLVKEMAVYLSVPRAASFAVTFRLGHSLQMVFPTVDPAESVIKEVLECIETLGAGEFHALEQRIPDPAYRRNFLALTKRIAPDGDAVRAVGFTASIQGTERRVLLERTADQITALGPTAIDAQIGQQIEVNGTLKYADSTKKDRDEIRIVDTQGKMYKIVVPEGMMDDIVRPLWDFEVRIRGRRQGEFIVLEDILRTQGGDTT